MENSTSDLSRKPLICGECKNPLPITVSHGSDANSLECAYCGSLYMGRVWDEVPEHLQGGVRIRKRAGVGSPGGGSDAKGT
jgi:hypothetical protein